MSDAKPGPTVPNGTRADDEYGRMTHVERINAGSNPADGTGAWPSAAQGAPPKPANPSEYGPLRAYRLLADAFSTVRQKAGEIVMLYPHQVGAHHELVEPETAGEAGAEGRGAIELSLAAATLTAQPSPTARLPLEQETEMSPEQFDTLMAVLAPIAECSKRVLAEMDRQAATTADVRTEMEARLAREQPQEPVHKDEDGA